MHSRILFHLIAVVKGNVIREPLSDAAGSQAADNVTFVKQQMTQLLVASFPNMQAAQIEVIFAKPWPSCCAPTTVCSYLLARGIVCTKGMLFTMLNH